MKKTVLASLLLLAGALGLWLWGPSRHHTAVGTATTVTATKKKLRPIKSSLNDKLLNRSSEVKPSDPLDVCAPLFEKLTQLTYEEMSASLPTLEADIDKDCRAAMEKNFQPVLRQLLASCQSGQKFNPKDCEQFFSLLRARSIAQAMNRKLPLSKWSESELMNTILWQFVEKPHPSQASLADNLALINELLARVPDSYAAEKAKFVHLLLQELLHKDASGGKELEASWRNLMEYGAEESLRYFPILKPMMRGDLAGFNQQVRKWQTENPSDPMGYYYAAFSKWKAQDRSGTIRLLEQARKLDPKNPQIGRSLDAARAGRFQDPIFTLNFGFSFDDI